MSRFSRLALAIPLALGALLAASPEAVSQQFPTKPVTLIVPWPAGGGTDVHMRALAEITAKHLGQPIVIENRPGASGTLGPATMAATAKPDGYTIAQMPVTVFRLPYMQKTSFDPTKDFTWIIHVSGYVFGVAVKADAPWQSWKELLAYAKANPGKLTYSTPGAGGTQHITMEQVAKKEGVKWTQVPFKGGAEQAAALLGGHTDIAATTMGTMAALADAGQVRYLAFWTKERVKRFPNVPTLTEEGIPVVSTSPYGIAGPAGMDPKVVQVLHDAFKKGMEDPEHHKVLQQFDMSYEYLNSADYAQLASKTIAE